MVKIPGVIPISAAMIPKPPLTNAAGISYKSAAVIATPPAISAAVIVPPPPISAAMISPAATKALSQMALSKGGRLGESPFNLATEWTGVVARGCVGDTLGVFRVVDAVDEELVAFATPPAHLVTSGVTNIIVTINITKNCFTTG
jgi:hypothetical protein